MQAIATQIPISSVIRDLQDLPPLPHEAQSLVALLGNDEVYLGDLATHIERMPGLAARVVGVAASAYFGCPGAVRSIRDAVVRILGLELTKAVSLGMLLGGTLDTASCPAFRPARFWHEAMRTAGIARVIAARIDDEAQAPPEIAYLCGLLHALGLLALAHVEPDAVDDVLRARARGDGADLADLTIERLGLSPCEAGAILARRWGLPPVVCAAIRWHTDSRYAGEHHHVVAIVGLARAWRPDHGPRFDAGRWVGLGLGDEDAQAVAEAAARIEDEARVLAATLGDGSTT